MKRHQSLLNRLTAAAVSACMTVAIMLTPAVAAEQNTLTRAEVRDQILAFCDDYNSGATADTILKGYPDGSSREEQAATRIETLVMLHRAFSPLPEPDAYWSKVSSPGVEYADIPDWAQSVITDLSSAGILTDDNDGLLEPNESIDDKELELYLYRLFSAYGTNLRDDFYSSADRKDLNEYKFFPGYLQAGISVNISTENSKRIEKIIGEAVNSDPAPGTPEHTIKAFYTTWLEARNAATNISPIKPWLDAIDNSKTMAELSKLDEKIAKEMGINLLYTADFTFSNTDSSKYILILGTMCSSNGREFYENGKDTDQNAYRDYLAALMTLAGYSQTQAQTAARDYFNIELELSKIELSVEDLQDPYKSFNLYAWDDLQKALPGIDLKGTFESRGFYPEDQVCVTDPGALNYFGKLFTNENIEQVKTIMRINLLAFFEDYLGDSYKQNSHNYLTERYGSLDEAAPEEGAVSICKKDLGDILGRLYVDRHFSTEAKADVEKIVREMLDTYAGRINNLTWMSDDTKAMAKKKLESMTINIGYPNEWPDTLDNVTLKAADEDGNIIENLCIINQAKMRKNSSYQGKPVDRELWYMNIYDVNAYYMLSNNSINFPAGILQAPFYSYDASRAENLGAIGTVIGHEISHAFDNNGAQYDENGNVTNWWTPQDYAEFDRLCQSVSDYYDGWEAQPGVITDGARTLSENIADIAGVRCALDLLKKDTDTPDYGGFFKSYSKSWDSILSPAYAAQQYATDVHAPSNLRVNRVLSSMDEFYETYNIKEGDGMYVSPENRVSIW